MQLATLPTKMVFGKKLTLKERIILEVLCNIFGIIWPIFSSGYFAVGGSKIFQLAKCKSVPWIFIPSV